MARAKNDIAQSYAVLGFKDILGISIDSLPQSINAVESKPAVPGHIALQAYFLDTFKAHGANLGAGRSYSIAEVSFDSAS